MTATTQPAPLVCEWITDESAGRRLGVTVASVRALCDRGVVRAAWCRPTQYDRRRANHILMVNAYDVRDVGDRSRDGRQDDPLAGLVAREGEVGVGTVIGRRTRRGVPANDHVPREIAAQMAAADARELERRRSMRQTMHRRFPLPVL